MEYLTSHLNTLETQPASNETVAADAILGSQNSKVRAVGPRGHAYADSWHDFRKHFVLSVNRRLSCIAIRVLCALGLAIILLRGANHESSRTDSGCSLDYRP